jgi:hypothetical protein
VDNDQRQMLYATNLKSGQKYKLIIGFTILASRSSLSSEGIHCDTYRLSLISYPDSRICDSSSVAASYAPKTLSNLVLDSLVTSDASGGNGYSGTKELEITVTDWNQVI